MRFVHNFDRVYIPDGFVVRSIAESSSSGNDRDANCTVLKCKAEQISRSYSEIFSMFTSGNSSEVEAAELQGF